MGFFLWGFLVLGCGFLIFFLGGLFCFSFCCFVCLVGVFWWGDERGSLIMCHRCVFY